MATKVMTSIYLTPSQKRALARRAKQHQTTMSEEIRSALDKHVMDSSGEDDDKLQLSLLAGEANKSMDRMIQKLDEAHACLNQVRKRLSRRNP